MTRGQRRLLGVVACLVVVVSLAWLAAAAGSDGDRQVEAGPDRAPETEHAAPDTTLPLVPVTGGAPLPPTSTTPSSIPLPTAEQIAAAVPTTIAGSGVAPPHAGVALTGDGALLVRPADAVGRTIDKAKGCHSAIDPGWKMVDCGALRRADGVLLWTVQGKGRALRAAVLRERTAGTWVPVLSASDETGERWSKIGVHGADVSGDGTPDLVFGFHGRDQGRALGVDVVDGPGTVGLHLLLAGGAVRAEPGSLQGWSVLQDGSVEHSTFRVLAGAWRVASSERVPAGSVPPSMV
ncbi:MAG TPA: hypothetical protein VFV35_03260 [Acidimicrobiales bacterium]|nr:hypothetical protein [Acidimicrobiales bacterium]